MRPITIRSHRPVRRPLGLVASAGLMAALATGCGGSGGPGTGHSQAGTAYVYVANNFVDVVSGFEADLGSGELDAVTGSPFAGGGGGPLAMVAHPSQPIIYVAAENTVELHGYAVDGASGGLTLLAGFPV